jgi:hypothetical protein
MCRRRCIEQQHNTQLNPFSVLCSSSFVLINQEDKVQNRIFYSNFCITKGNMYNVSSYRWNVRIDSINVRVDRSNVAIDQVNVCIVMSYATSDRLIVMD